MSAIFVDSHCHLNSKGYETPPAQLITQAQQKGISKMISICTKKEEIDEILELTMNPGVYGSVGIHPHEADITLKEMTTTELKEWLRHHCHHEKIVALGETGLDFFYNHSSADHQKKCFYAHLEVALETDIPVSVHTRTADQETIQLLSEIKGVRGVIHCFSGSAYLAEKALNLGFYISVSGIITFQKAEELRAIIRDVPLERLLLETDAPFLAPVPYRGKQNEPAFLIETAKRLAEIKEISLEKLAEITTHNFFTLFTKAQDVSK